MGTPCQKKISTITTNTTATAAATVSAAVAVVVVGGSAFIAPVIIPGIMLMFLVKIILYLARLASIIVIQVPLNLSL